MILRTMKREATKDHEFKDGSPTMPENCDQLAETARAAFRALPVKYRTPIFKKATPGSPTIRAVIQAAHIPPSFQAGRIALWLTAEQQRKLEELVLSPGHEAWLESLLRDFFCKGHKSL